MWNKQVEGMKNGRENGVGKMKICSLVLSALFIVMLAPVVSAEENKINITYIAYSPSVAFDLAGNTNKYVDSIKYTYIPAYNTTTWGASDELLAAVESGLLQKQNVIFCDMFSSGLHVQMNDTFKLAHDNGTSLLDIRSDGTPCYFDYASNGSVDDTICNYYSNMGTQTEEEIKNSKDFLIHLAKVYGNRPDITADWDKVNIMYIGWAPSPALEMASQISEHNESIKYTYIPSFNTTTWASPSDELIAAGQSGLLEKQDVIFCDMLSSAVYEPLNSSFWCASDNGTSLLDICSAGTPSYFDYVSNGSVDDPICNYYNNMGTETEPEKDNAVNFLEYLAEEYGNRPDITAAWDAKIKIKIMYIAYSQSTALETASQTNIRSENIDYTYIPAYNTTTWGASYELLEAAQIGLLEEYDVIFCDMFSSGLHAQMNYTFRSVHDKGTSLLDIRSGGTPPYFDYVSNGSTNDPVCNYYNNMGTDSVGIKNAENLLICLAKEYGNHPEITDNWISIKIMYIAWTPSSALEMASQTNPYGENIEYTYIPSYNTTTWAGPSDELIAADQSGLLEEQDVIFCDMLSSAVYEPMNDSFKKAHDNGTSLVDIRSINTPIYFDYVSNGSIDDLICNYYNNMGTGTPGQLRNAENLLIYLAKEYGANLALTASWEYVNATSGGLPEVGLYHPDYEHKYFETTVEYMDWYQQDSSDRRVYNPSKPTIGMWFHRSDIQNGQTGVVDALISDLESKDCNVIVGFDTFDNIVQYYCDENEEPLVQCVISLKSFRLNYWDPEQGEAELKQLNVPILRGIVAEVPESPDPADANRGIPNSQMVRKTISPNLDGIFEYILVGNAIYNDDSQTSEYVPIDRQVDWICNRSIKWAELKLAENPDKKVAVIYYNYPSGKDNIGASYLDTISSMRLLLEKMVQDNYTVTDVPVNNSELLERIQAQGINAGSWAPGVLDEMVVNQKEWGLQLISMDTYRQWFNKELPQDVKDAVIKEWGEPWSEELPQNKSLMVWENETGKYLVIPAVQYGNVWLMPQPARGFLQNDDTLYHSSIVPPPHQYIAFYLWLNNEWDPDAIIHFGTHGTHEWLPGKAYGLDRNSDWAPLLLQDMPNIYPYIVANVGEGLTAEFRGNALIIDHMTPTLERSGSYGEIANLARLMQVYYGPEMSDTTKNAYKLQIVNEMVKINLDIDLSLDATELADYNVSQFDDFVKNILHEYIEEIEGENIPYGMHVLGEVPSTNATGCERDELSMMVRSMLKNKFEEHICLAFYPESDYPLGIPSNDTKVDRLLWETVTNGTYINDSQMMVYGKINATVAEDLARGLVYRDRLVASSVEMYRVIAALNAGFIPPGPGTDPVMNPDAVPTGRNFYGVNPELYPSKATWELGKYLARQMLEDYYIKHNGTYPRKVSFSRFGVEFIRDHGTLEAEAMYMLGIKPVWDESGYVVGVKEIPEEELLPNYDPAIPGRPRIDIVYATAGMRDAFPSKIKMLDDAVKLASTIEPVNYPNYVNESTSAIYDNLYDQLSQTMDNESAADLARKLSTMRCFAVRDGTYEIGTGNAVDASGSWENEEEIAQIYLKKMGFAYGSELWGYECSELLVSNLMNVDASVHSDSSNLYDTLDNDDFYQYFGVLNLATRYVSGSTPEMYVSDTRDPDQAMMTGMREYLMKNIRSRYFNPKWIQGMQESGYAGGRMMAEFVDNLWGWEVSDPDLVDDKVWDQVYNTYVNEEMKEWFNANNAGAYQSITARMLEATRKLDNEGNPYWNADPDVIESLVREYVESVADNGVTCCHHTCGNPLLNEYISGMLSVPGLSAEDAEEYRKLMDEATGRQTEQPVTETINDDSSSSAWRRLHDSGTGNESTDAGSGAGLDTELLQDAGAGGEGVSNPSDYVEGYEMQDESARSADAGPISFSSTDIAGMLLVVLAAGAIYIGFRRRGS